MEGRTRVQGVMMCKTYQVEEFICRLHSRFVVARFLSLTEAKVKLAKTSKLKSKLGGYEFV